jgi:hypothetical protein
MTAPSSSYNIDTKKGQKFWLLGDVYTFYITGGSVNLSYFLLRNR